MAKRGRPTDYRPEMIDKINQYINACPDKFPTRDALALDVLHVNGDTIVEWEKKIPEFSAVMARFDAFQRKMLILNGLNGSYKEGFAKFVGINCCGMREKVEQTVNATIEGSVDLSGGIAITWTDEKIPH